MENQPLAEIRVSSPTSSFPHDHFLAHCWSLARNGLQWGREAFAEEGQKTIVILDGDDANPETIDANSMERAVMGRRLSELDGHVTRIELALNAADTHHGMTRLRNMLDYVDKHRVTVNRTLDTEHRKAIVEEIKSALLSTGMEEPAYFSSMTSIFATTQFYGNVGKNHVGFHQRIGGQTVAVRKLRQAYKYKGMEHEEAERLAGDFVFNLTRSDQRYPYARAAGLLGYYYASSHSYVTRNVPESLAVPQVTPGDLEQMDVLTGHILRWVKKNNPSD